MLLGFVVAAVLLLVTAAVLYFVGSTTRTGLSDEERERQDRALIRRLRKIEIITSRKANEQLAGQYHSVFKGRGMSFDEVRQYQPGDDVRFIDWNVSARTNDVYIKRFVEERELTVMLLVDVSTSLEFGLKSQSKRDVAVELAALLAFSAVKNNDRVGLVLFTDRIERFVPPKKGRKHVMRLVTEILNFHPEGQKTDLNVPLEYLSRVMKRQAVAFVISDFHVPVENYLRSLRIVARRHDLVPVMVRDEMEKAFPDLGLAVMQDLETGEPVWVDSSSRRVRGAYRENAESRHARILQVFRRHKLDVIDVETGGSYVQALVQFFQLRARRT